MSGATRVINQHPNNQCTAGFYCFGTGSDCIRCSSLRKAL